MVDHNIVVTKNIIHTTVMLRLVGVLSLLREITLVHLAGIEYVVQTISFGHRPNH